MKIKYYFILAFATFLSNCSQENEPQEIQSNSTHTITATIEGGSRSVVTDNGIFSWTIEDEISVWNGSKVTYPYSGNDNEFSGSPNISGYAIYPAGEHTNLSGTGLPIVNLKTSYSYGSTNAIMMAKAQGSNNLSFNHLGGLMRFTIKNIPSNATSFTFTANSGITGDFQLEKENGTNVIKAATAPNSNNTVTINFQAGSLTEGKGTFYIPLPIGTYTGFTIAIGNQKYKSSATNTINRRTLLLMPTFTCDGTQLVKGDNTISLANTTTPQSTNISGDKDLVIETTSSTSAGDTKPELTLNYTPTDNATLTISDKQNGSPTVSTASVVVDVQDVTKKVKELTIDAPTLTVVLASGEYGTVTSKTATETLIIKEGVKIDKLIIKGGKVETEEGATITKTEKDNIVLRVLTFEDKDAKFKKYNLDYAGVDITTWSDLIDDPQYGGPLTYADYMSAEYHWYDEGNTELTHTFPNNYAYCFWGGGHAISNYWGAGWSDEDRDVHIAKYYGEDYVSDNAGNDAMLGWFNLQMMIPVKAHSGDNFAVHYGYKDFFSYVENLPEISFEDGEARVIDHMYVTNTNYTLNQLYNGVKSEAGNSFGGNWSGLTEDAWLKIVAYGFDDVEADANAEPISEVEFYLVQGENVVTDWQKWDLSGLGAVKKVRFNFLYSEEMGGRYGLTIPGYFAYDDIAVRFEE